MEEEWRGTCIEIINIKRGRIGEEEDGVKVKLIITFYCDAYEACPSAEIRPRCYRRNDDVTSRRRARGTRRPGRRKSYRTSSFLSFVAGDRSRSSRPESPVPRIGPRRFACGCSGSPRGDSSLVCVAEATEASSRLPVYRRRVASLTTTIHCALESHHTTSIKVARLLISFVPIIH